MSRRLYPVPKKVIRSSATSGWGAGCKFGSWGCWEGIDANRRLTTIQSISLAPSRKPGTGIQRTGWVRARCGRPSLFATRGVPCQWRSRSARTDRDPEDLPHATKRVLVRFRERVASATCSEGRPRRRNWSEGRGVLAYRFQIFISVRPQGLGGSPWSA